MEEMANQINYVMVHFGLKTFIGFGVGAGAHVLTKFAISNPDKVRVCLFTHRELDDFYPYEPVVRLGT